MTKHNEDNYDYKGWLNSDSFCKRAVASVGYQAVGGLIIYACIGIPALIIIGIASL